MWHLVLVLCTVVAVVTHALEYAYDRDEDPHAPRNLIMMIPDGTSPNVFTMARAMHNQPSRKIEKALHIDALLRGTVKTYSNTSLVPDSAATASAYATGYKTYDKAIGMDVSQQPLGNVLEAAKAKGMVVGIIATSRVTHATPAAFSTHVSHRDDEVSIAGQIVANKNIDFLLGGGQRYFSASQCQNMTAAGYSIVSTEEELRAYRREHEVSGTLRLLGLFAQDHMAFEIDRHRTSQPSLSSMTSEILRLLEHNTQAKKYGYFILIEGSRIDHGAHVNDPVAMVYDALEFDRTIGVVKTQVESHSNTALISVADHGTGGLTLGKAGVYAWEPEILTQVHMSTEWMGTLLTPSLVTCLVTFPDVSQQTKCCTTTVVPEIRHILAQMAHITTLSSLHLSWIETQLQELVQVASKTVNVSTSSWNSDHWSTYELERVLGWIISDVARIAWTTGGHTGTDVNLYCYGPKSVERMCQGVHENTFVNHIMKTYLVLDMQTETLRLREFQARHQRREKNTSPLMQRYHAGL